MIAKTVRMLAILGLLWIIGSSVHTWWPVYAADPINSILLLLYVCGFAVVVKWLFGMVFASDRKVMVHADAARIATAALPLPAEEVETCARHEAMHAVAALQFGVTINEVVIRRSGNSGGYTSYQRMEHLELTDRHWAQAVISLAPTGSNDGSNQDDDSKALSHVIQVLGIGERPTGYHGPWEMTSLMTTALKTGKLIVDQRAAAVERITAALIEKRRLTGAEIAALAKSS